MLTQLLAEVMMIMMMIMMMIPGWIQRQTQISAYRTSSAGAGVTHSQQLEVGGLRNSSVFACQKYLSDSPPSVHPPNLPHQTPAPVIDGTEENLKPFFSVTQPTFTNKRAIHYSLLPAPQSACDVSDHNCCSNDDNQEK